MKSKWELELTKRRGRITPMQKEEHLCKCLSAGVIGNKDIQQAIFSLRVMEDVGERKVLKAPC